MFLDIHSHLDEYSDEELHGILHRGIEVGVTGVVSAGTDLRSSARCVYLSSRFDGVFAGIGVHPMKIQAPLDESHFASLREMALSTDKVLMVSEVGLDFLAGMPDKAWQYDAFRNQIRLARELRLPIVFHSRESHSEVLRLLREERAYEVGGAMHYFQADLRIASEAIDLGFYISIARPFLRLPWLQKVIASLPIHTIVLETDTAPQPFKKKPENRTEPRHVRDIAEKLAEIHAIPMDEIEIILEENAKRMFRERWHTVKRRLKSGSRL